MGNPKIWNIWKTADRRVKWMKFWDSGVVVTTYMWGTLLEDIEDNGYENIVFCEDIGYHGEIQTSITFLDNRADFKTFMAL